MKPGGSFRRPGKEFSTAGLGLEASLADKPDIMVPAGEPVSLSAAQEAFLDSLDTCRTQTCEWRAPGVSCSTSITARKYKP